MLHRLRHLLNRPLVEDFSGKNQLWMSVQGGLYVFIFIYLFGGIGQAGSFSRLALLTFFGVAVCITTLVANYLVPLLLLLLPALYDEERWTVGKHALHVLFVLLCVSIGNQLVLLLTGSDYPPFWQMYFGEEMGWRVVP